jgi:hypothetical protein
MWRASVMDGGGALPVRGGIEPLSGIQSAGGLHSKFSVRCWMFDVQSVLGMIA